MNLIVTNNWIAIKYHSDYGVFHHKPKQIHVFNWLAAGHRHNILSRVPAVKADDPARRRPPLTL